MSLYHPHVYFLIIPFGIYTFIPNISVTIRRFHDINMSGWWYLLFNVLFIIPILGLIGLGFFIYFMAKKGTEGENRFGPKPGDEERRLNNFDNNDTTDVKTYNDSGV